MKIIFSELARREMADAIRFYENRVVGLGKRLESEIVRASSRISEHPEAWPVERGTIQVSRHFQFSGSMNCLLIQFAI